MKLIPKLSELKWLPIHEKEFWLNYHAMSQLLNEFLNASEPKSMFDILERNPNLSLMAAHKEWKELEKSRPKPEPSPAMQRLREKLLRKTNA